MSVSKMMIGQNLPQWVPPGALHYIAHTENGEPIRALARKAGCHASTILRQIRKVEMRRDDPLVDAALSKLGGAAAPDVDQPRRSEPGRVSRAKGKMPDDDTLSREAMRILRRLCETGAVLAVAADLEKAVVVRDAPGGAGARTAVVDTDIAQAMALNDWITSNDNGRISRYHITTCGRAALADFINRFGSATEKPNGSLRASHCL